MANLFIESLGDALRRRRVRTAQESVVERFEFDSAPGQLGVIAETVLNRTVSGIEERAAQLSQGWNLLFERFGSPDIAAAEADLFPTERSVGE